MPGTGVRERSGCFTGTGCRFEKPERCRDGGGDGKPQCGCLMTPSGTLKPHSCGFCPDLKRYIPLARPPATGSHPMLRPWRSPWAWRRAAGEAVTGPEPGRGEGRHPRFHPGLFQTGREASV